MSLADLDTYYIKSVASLHSKDHLLNNEPSILQTNLEEAIKTKTGIVKDFTSLIASSNSRALEDIKTTTTGIEESKTTSSSDNELELDLFNEDLMCIICNGMDVGARNRLLECSDCHSLYHQECHRPPVTSHDVDSTWTCQNCKDAAKRIKRSNNSSPSYTTVQSPTGPKSNARNSPSHSQAQAQIQIPCQPQRPGTDTSTPASSNQKISNTKSINGLTVPKVITKPSKSASSSSNAKNSITPNIISADKRLQIMKKKAAKLHEKRKQFPR